MKLAVLLATLALLAAVEQSEGCFWRRQQPQNQKPDWLTKETLNEFNSALDKQQKNRGRRDVSTSAEEGVVAGVTPTEAPTSGTSFWSNLGKGVKDIYKKAKDDAKTLADRLEENLGI
jgi:hypothetical protein